MTETEECYYNAYQLLIGDTNYDKLAEQEVFYLPENHEDPRVVLSYYESIKDYEKLLRYYESIEDYEKCKKIVERNS